MRRIGLSKPLRRKTILNSPIALTEKAQQKAAALLKESDAAYIRVYLAGKGCDGFTYGVALSDKEEGDHHFMDGDIPLVCDEASFGVLDGSCIDYVDDDRGQGFLVENPNHKKFRGKFFRKGDWKERLLAKN